MGILGGQAVQAARLVRAGTAIRTSRPGSCRSTRFRRRRSRRRCRIKYLRTVATQLTYCRCCFRELRRADVVHVFSASYFSFLLAPLPAVADRPVVREAGGDELSQREAPDHLQPIGDRARRRYARWTATPSRPRFLHDVFARLRHRLRRSSRTSSTSIGSRFGAREPLRPRLLSTRNFESLYNVRVHAARVSPRAGSLPGRDV